MDTKLYININEGIVKVKGNEDFVREVYTDYRNEIFDNFEKDSPAQKDNKGDSGTKRKKIKKTESIKDKKTNNISFKTPKIDNNVDATNLTEFYKGFNPADHSDKILIFLSFLKENLEIESPNSDQVYTCFLCIKQKIPKVMPKAYGQAFVEAKTVKKYIDYNSAEEITITPVGTNRFNELLEKKKMGEGV